MNIPTKPFKQKKKVIFNNLRFCVGGKLRRVYRAAYTEQNAERFRIWLNKKPGTIAPGYV